MNSNDWKALLQQLDGCDTPNKRGKVPKCGKREAFFDCMNRRRTGWMMGVRPSDLSITAHPLRCQLKQHCPKCMSVGNVVDRREPDFFWMKRVGGLLDGGPNGSALKVWVVTWESSERPPSASRLAAALGRSDGRYRPMMIGPWGGEVIIDTLCAELETITRANGPKFGTSFVFNALLFAGPGGALDLERLREWLPGCHIDTFHGSLRRAWEFYLKRWSTMRIDSSSVAQVATWVNQGRRGFTAIGALYGEKTKEKAAYLRELRRLEGRSVPVARISEDDECDKATERMRRNLQGTQGWNLFKRPLRDDEIECILRRVEIELRKMLSLSALG